MVVIFVDQQTDIAKNFNSHVEVEKKCKSKRDRKFKPQSAAAERPNVLVERYKTKMCRNYMVNGSCNYHSRCMFAHGEHELRTTDMNVRDGLFTEEAIKSFQRAMTAYNKGDLVRIQQQAQANSYQYSQHPVNYSSYTQEYSCGEDAVSHIHRTHNPYYTAIPAALPSATQYIEVPEQW